MQDKAYKLLAAQENISNSEAKALIDSGLVSARGNKITLARELMSSSVTFDVQKIQKSVKIFEDEFIVAVNKPNFMLSENLEKIYKAKLLNRLDKETSGVVLLYKDEEFRARAIKEFKNLNVKKTYIAIVKGIVSEPFSIEDPILTIKGNGGAFSRISSEGKSAITHVEPLMVSGKKSLVKIRIETGRTHQIRVHLTSVGHGIIGDEKYAKSSSKRMFLHAYEVEILDYKFRANLDGSFGTFGFEIPRNFI